MDNKNGLERHGYHYNIVHRDFSSSHHPVWKGIIKRLFSSNQTMEVKLITIIACIIGYPSIILGFASNMGWVILGNWKSSVLFWLGATFFLIKIVVYCIRQYQEIRSREIDIEKKKKKHDDEIFS